MSAHIIDLYRQAEDYFFRGISLKCLKLTEGIAYMTGVPVADLNLVYIRSMPTNIAALLKTSKKYYDNKKLDFVVIIPEEFCSNGIDEAIQSSGYTQTGSSVTMSVKIDGLKLINVTQFDDDTAIYGNSFALHEWMMPLVGAFESTHEFCMKYKAAHERAQQKKLEFYHFSLYQKSQEKPIASITLTVDKGVARIDDVGTLPEFQGKGYATCLVNFALYYAQHLGAKYCFLEASDSGLSIYKKIGFEPLFKNNIYSRKA